MVSILQLTTTLLATASFAFAATNFHVNSGCAQVNNEFTCQGKPAIVNGGVALVQACLDKQDIPHCTLNASWDADFGDVFFGTNDCLYDANGNQISSECAS